MRTFYEVDIFERSRRGGEGEGGLVAGEVYINVKFVEGQRM